MSEAEILERTSNSLWWLVVTSLAAGGLAVVAASLVVCWAVGRLCYARGFADGLTHTNAHTHGLHSADGLDTAGARRVNHPAQCGGCAVAGADCAGPEASAKSGGSRPGAVAAGAAA